MKAAGMPDALTILNGPEDGTEFPITRRGFVVGRDPSCYVNVRLDHDIAAMHGRVTAVADGYRVRSIAGVPLFVNQLRAGILRSRVLRSGDVLRIGHTELVLECAPDGVASRARGLSFENDFTWAIRRSAASIFALSRAALVLAFNLTWRVWTRWKFLALMGGIAAYVFIPGVRTLALEVFSRLQDLLSRVIPG